MEALNTPRDLHRDYWYDDFLCITSIALKDFGADMPH